MHQSPYRIEVFGVADLNRIGWPGTADDSSFDLFVFQSREFLQAWFMTMGTARGSEPLLVAVFDASKQPILYLPLCLERRLGVRILRFPDGGVSDYCAPLLRKGGGLDAGVFGVLWRKILAALPPVDIVFLRNMPDRVVETPNPFLGLDLGKAEGRGSYVCLQAGWEAYRREPARSGMLSQADKKLRKLARDHKVSFEEALRTAPPPPQWIECILEQKRRQYLRTIGEDILAVPGYEAFFRHMAKPEQLGSISTLDCLLVDGQIAVGHLGYATTKRRYYILISTDYEQFGKYSVGTALFSHLLQQSFSEGRQAYDLGIGSEPYKDLWAIRRYDLYSYLKPLTLKGRVVAEALAAKRSLLAKRIRRLPIAAEVAG